MGLISDDYLNDPLTSLLRPDEKPLAEQQEEDFGFFDYAGDIAAAPFRGLAGAVEGIAEIGNIIPGVDYDIASNLGLGESETFVGGAIEGITEFATAFIPVAGWVGRGAKVAKMGKMAGGLEKAAKAKGAKGWAARRGQEAIAGGIADFAVIQGHEARLSDLIEQFPALQNPVTEFLQSDEDDSEIVGRLKAAVEGIGAGVVFDSLLLGVKALRKGKGAFDETITKGGTEEAANKKAAEAIEEVHREADEAGARVGQKPTVKLNLGEDQHNVELPAIYIRAGDLPTDEAGNLTASYAGGPMIDLEPGATTEAGVSVYAGYRDPRTGFIIIQSDGSDTFHASIASTMERPLFEVSGKDTGSRGADGEPLLEVGSIEIQGSLDANKIILDTDFHNPEQSAVARPTSNLTPAEAAERDKIKSQLDENRNEQDKLRSEAAKALNLPEERLRGASDVIESVSPGYKALEEKNSQLSNDLFQIEHESIPVTNFPSIQGKADIEDVLQGDSKNLPSLEELVEASKKFRDSPAPKTLDDTAGSADYGPKDFRHGGEEIVDLIAEAEALVPNPKRKRGSDNIFKRLELETNLTGDREQLQGVRTFMDEMGPEYFDDLGISIHRNLSAKGRMEFGPEIIRIAKRTVENGELEDTMIHELWHKLSQNLPKKDLLAVRKSYQKALDKQPVIKELLEEGSFNQARYDELVAKHGKEKVDAVVKKNGDSYSLSINNRENYRFTDEDEWFAETMREVTQGRLDFLNEAAPSGTVKRIFQDLGVIFRDLWVYTKEKFGFAGPERRIFNDFLKGKRLKRQRRGGLQGRFTARMADDTAGSDGIPEGDVADVLDERATLEELGVEEIEPGKVNLRGISGELGPSIRAVENVMMPKVRAEVAASDDEVITANLESFAAYSGLEPEAVRKMIAGNKLSAQETNEKILFYKQFIEQFSDEKLKPALDAVTKADLEGSLSDEQILRAMQEITSITGLLDEFTGLRTAQSQGLRLMADSELFTQLTKDEAVMAAMKDNRESLIEELGGRKAIVEKVKAIRQVMEAEGLEAAMKAIKKQKHNKWLLALNEGFINNILSGPKTLVTNFLGPMMVSAYRPLETGLGALARGDMKIARRSMREFTGLLTGFNDAMRLARMSFKQDELILDATARQVDVPGSQRRAISAGALGFQEQSNMGAMFNVMGKAMGVPTRFLGATDEFVKQLNYRTVVRADLMEQGAEKGLSGQPLAAFVEKEMDKMVINGAALTGRNLDRAAKEQGLTGIDKHNFIQSALKNGDLQDRQALATRALETAREVTFTRELKDSESHFRSLSRSGQMAVNAHPMLRPFIPFVRTPVNLLSFAGERMVDPVTSMARMAMGLRSPKELKKVTQNRKRFVADLASEDPQRKAEAYGRAIAGLGFAATGITFASSGNLTGGGPKDYKQKKILEQAGWQPYSIKVGDDYFSYQRADPFASMLGIFADINDISRYAPPEMQEEVESLGFNVAVAFARNMGSKTYLQGVMDLAGLMEDPERFVGKTARKMAGSMIPFSGLLGQGVQAVGGDESMREIRTWTDAMKAKIPFLSQEVDAQRNFMGEPSERYMSLGGRWTDWWLPVMHSTTSSDPINRELARLGHAFSPPTSNRYNVDMRSITGASGQSAYDRWMELHQEVRIGGRSLNQAMNRLIRSSGYRRLSPEGFGDEDSPRVIEITKLVRKYRSKAESQLWREFPEVHAARKNKMVIRRAQRTGQTTESIRASLFPLD